MSGYRFDSDLQARVSNLLFELLPQLYRLKDERLDGAGNPIPGDLQRFIGVLAVPLAEVRQSIEELHADLFIDSAADWVIPYLAQMVGTRLVFPSADQNRLDVRGTVAWRRRKGTPSTLQELGSELSGKTLVTQEGWKRLMLSQDLNLLRRDRDVVDLRPLRLAEQARGPLDAVPHAMDARSLSAREGGVHPRAVGHWLHPTALFPLRGGTAFARSDATPTDLRYAFHPLGRQFPLRARRVSESDRLKTDRIPPMHFASDPGASFGVPGRFDVRIAGLSAAVAKPEQQGRRPAKQAVDDALIAAAGTISLLEHEPDRLTGPLKVELYAAALDGANKPDLANAKLRAGLTLDRDGASAPSAGSAAVAGKRVAVLRLAPVAGSGEHLTAATVEVASSAVGARLAAKDVDLAVEGFLRGALVLTLPEGWVMGERWCFIAQDGSLYDAGTKAAPLAVSAGAGGFELPGVAITVGVGAAWPPLPATSTDEPCTQVPSAPGCGPAHLHGGNVLADLGGGAFGPASGTAKLALSFAARHQATTTAYAPFLRLEWSGADPSTAKWTAVDAAGAATANVLARFKELAELREWARELELVVRLEADAANLVLPPCEVAYPASGGRTVLVHLPELRSGGAGAAAGWAKALPNAGAAVAVAEDGSTHLDGSIQRARSAHGDVAPIRERVTLTRRRVRGRSLCQWDREDATHHHEGTKPGFLDVDVGHALFAFATAEPPQGWSASATLAAPPAVSVDYEDAYSDHVGARPAPREPLLRRTLPAPTRIVTRGGAHRADAPTGYWDAPHYPSVTAALAAIAASPEPDEVVEVQDSATYDAEAPVWPRGPKTLTLQAAERQRPVLRLASFAVMPGAAYESLTLTGLAWSGTSVSLPPCAQVTLETCSVLDAADALEIAAPGLDEVAGSVVRCLLGPLKLTGRGKLAVEDSVIDAGAAQALESSLALVELDRVTVLGSTKVFALEASDCIFAGAVTVEDQFQGCVRYSRVPTGATLPRKHRVVEGGEVRFVSVDRQHAAHARLAEDCDAAIARGGHDASEMGAFSGVRFAQRYEALARRLVEYTPAGMTTGIVRLD